MGAVKAAVELEVLSMGDLLSAYQQHYKLERRELLFLLDLDEARYARLQKLKLPRPGFERSDTAALARQSGCQESLVRILLRWWKTSWIAL